MKRPLLILIVLMAGLSSSYSKDHDPRKAENKAETSGSNNKKGDEPQGYPLTLPPWVFTQAHPNIINVFTAKHADEKSQCTAYEDRKEWGAFAWCMVWEWPDAERVIAIFTVVLGFATWLLWRSTDRLVRGAEETAERQLRAHISVAPKDLHFLQQDAPAFATFAIKNNGLTPASDMRYVAALERLEFPLPENQGDLVAPIIGQRLPRQPVHPGAEVIGEAIDVIGMNKKDFEEIFSGIGHPLFIFGMVIYNDVFGIERRTKFCAYVDNKSMKEAFDIAKQNNTVEITVMRTRIQKPVMQVSGDFWVFSDVHNDAD